MASKSRKNARKIARICSMTGHGRGEAGGAGGNVWVELSSVNGRQLYVRVNIPRDLAMLEPMIHDLVGDAVSRGNVSVVVRYAAGKSHGKMTIDEKLAGKYVKELRKVGKKLKLKDDLSIESIVALPDVVRLVGTRDDSGLRQAVKQAVGDALRGMLAMREREGRTLAADIRKRLSGLGERVKKVRGMSSGVARRYRRNLLDRMKKVGADFKAQSPQILREIAIYADKADITEEIVRLDSHLAQGREILGKGGSIGRTLDFLCQEIFREINTIGSKANDSGISRIVVDFKAELEAIREQVQNVE